MTADSADYQRHNARHTTTVEDMFQDVAPVTSADDLARDGVFDSAELEAFLADLVETRRADLA